MFEPGQRVGEYELVRGVAAGGMAHVFVARRDGDDRPFAMKVIHEHLSTDWQAMRWFVDEALISIRIRHPNVVRVDELGEQDGLYYLAMEYVHGCSLAELMVVLGRRGRRIDPWISAWIAARVAEGLHAAHELRGDDGELLNVIHRDVSPQNILLSSMGEVKLTDFGIAKAKGRASRTMAGELRGKFRYMAPEQIVDRDAQDRRVDIFTLGVVLWELLTQTRLHAKMDHVDLLERLKKPEVERPSLVRPDVPPALDGVVLNAVAASPAERPETAQVFQRELDEALSLARIDPQEALRELMLEVLGQRLLESAQALPADLAHAIGIEHFEPTDPRGLDSGAAAAAAAAQIERDDPSAPFVFEEPLVVESPPETAAAPMPSTRPVQPLRSEPSQRVRTSVAPPSTSAAWLSVALLLGGFFVIAVLAAWLVLSE